MKKFLFVIGIIINSGNTFAQSGPGLGSEVGVMPNAQGNSSFHAAYTYGDDPDGKSYLLSFVPALSSSEKGKHLLWNFYIAGSADFLMPWDFQRDTQLAVIQIKVKDSSAVENILKNQGTKNGVNALYFVLADRNTKSIVYNLPISELCKEMPGKFSDLTNGKRCDEITNP